MKRLRQELPFRGRSGGRHHEPAFMPTEGKAKRATTEYRQSTQKWSLRKSAAVSDVADLATLVRATAAIIRHVAAIFGAPTADACVWAYCRDGSMVGVAECQICRERGYDQLLTPATPVIAALTTTTIMITLRTMLMPLLEIKSNI